MKDLIVNRGNYSCYSGDPCGQVLLLGIYDAFSAVSLLCMLKNLLEVKTMELAQHN